MWTSPLGIFTQLVPMAVTVVAIIIHPPIMTIPVPLLTVMEFLLPIVVALPLVALPIAIVLQRLIAPIGSH